MQNRNRFETWVAGAVALVASCGCGAGLQDAYAQGRAPGGGGELTVVARPEQAYVVQGSDGQLYVGVWVDAPVLVEMVRERPPMSVALVVDRSGSMAGAKIENARMAAASLIQSLRPGDTAALFAFDSQVYQLSAPVRITDATRAALLGSVSMLQAGSSTNLYGGVAAAIASLQTGLASDAAARRVILVSDGLANVGPSSPAEIGSACVP